MKIITDYYLAIQNQIPRKEIIHIENISRTAGHILSPSYALLNRVKYLSFLEYSKLLFSELFLNEPLTVAYLEMNKSLQTVMQLRTLSEIAEHSPLYLLCFCHKKQKCHREIIKALLLGLTPDNILKNISNHNDQLVLLEKQLTLDQLQSR